MQSDELRVLAYATEHQLQQHTLLEERLAAHYGARKTNYFETVSMYTMTPYGGIPLAAGAHVRVETSTGQQQQLVFAAGAP